MKTIAIAVAFLTTVTAFAGTTPIPREKLADYIDAVIMAIDGSAFECVTESGSMSGQLVDKVFGATSAEIDDAGAQPLLIFKSSDAEHQRIVCVTTSTDYKTLVSIRIEDLQVSTQEVNQGDLINPSMTSIAQISSVGVGVCKFKNP